MKPRAGGLASLRAWAGPFVDIATDFNGQTRSVDQRTLFSAIIAARRCASGAAVDELVQRVQTALASAGNDPSGTPLAQLFLPVACQ